MFTHDPVRGNRTRKLAFALEQFTLKLLIWELFIRDNGKQWQNIVDWSKFCVYKVIDFENRILFLLIIVLAFFKINIYDYSLIISKGKKYFTQICIHNFQRTIHLGVDLYIISKKVYTKWDIQNLTGYQLLIILITCYINL